MHEKLKNKIDVDISLEQYRSVKPLFKIPEWGFPKGRRLPIFKNDDEPETDFECAKREFEEETCYSQTDYQIFDSEKYIDENFNGTNDIPYRHRYYLAHLNSDTLPSIHKDKPLQYNEIGNIGLFTYTECLSLIRSYHTERKRILTNIYANIMNGIISLQKK